MFNWIKNENENEITSLLLCVKRQKHVEKTFYHQNA